MSVETCPMRRRKSALRMLSSGILRARLHVVLEAERVAHLVGEHVLEQPAHQRIGQRKLPSARIERRGLREVPGAREVLHVVVELDVRVEDLARARIVDVRAATRSPSWTAASGPRSSGRLPATSRDRWSAHPCAMIAFLKPAASNAGCQSSIAFLSHGRHFIGVLASR